jgi:hypothetical protein
MSPKRLFYQEPHIPEGGILQNVSVLTLYDVSIHRPDLQKMNGLNFGSCLLRPFQVRFD